MTEPKSLDELKQEAQGQRGLHCPECGFDTMISLGTVPGPNNTVFRIRQCRRCMAKAQFKEKIVRPVKDLKPRKLPTHLPPKGIAADSGEN